MGNEQNQPSEIPGDEELVKKSLSGDEMAFQQLVLKYQQRIYAVALGIVRQPEDALALTRIVALGGIDEVDPRVDAGMDGGDELVDILSGPASGAEAEF